MPERMIKMRRANGQGSVYKMSGNRRKPWRAMISKGKNISGYSKRVDLGCFATRIEAEAAIRQYLDAPIEKPNITLGELHEEWKAIKYASGISKQTQDSYNAAWKSLSLLENYKVKDIRTGQLQAVVDSCTNGASSKNNIRVLAGMLFKYAMQNDIISKNYAEFIVMPKSEKKERPHFTEMERKKIEDAVKNNVPWADTILILIYTGLRVNELLQMTPFSVVYDNEKPAFLRGGLKTVAGKNRIVPLHKKIVPYIEKWLDKIGKTIICTDNGDPVPYSQYIIKFKECLQDIGIRVLTPHATRHTWFSMTNAAGINDAVRQVIGGHAAAEITKQYTHPEMNELYAAINSLD